MRILGKPDPRSKPTMPAAEVAPALQNVEVSGERPTVRVEPEAPSVNVAPTTPPTASVPGELPTVRVEPEAPTTSVAPTATSPAAQSLVNKAAELGVTPPTAAVRPVPVNQKPGNSLAERTVRKQGILIEQSEKETTREGLLNEIFDAAVESGKNKLTKVRMRKTGGAGTNDFRKQLIAIANSETPKFTMRGANIKAGSNTGGLNLPLQAKEKSDIVKDVKGRLRLEALNVYRKAATKENELNFTLNGFKKGDENFGEVMQLLDAIDAEAFGYPRQLQALREEWGNETFEKIYKILKENSDDEYVKEVGKKWEKAEPKKLGITSGLLADEAPEQVVRKESRLNRGKANLSDFVLKPLSAEPGSYMNVFARAVDRALSKSKLGPEWKKKAETDEKMLQTFAGLDYLLRDKPDGTQPKDYIKALADGQRAKGRRLNQERSDEQMRVAQEVNERKAGQNQYREEANDGWNQEGASDSQILGDRPIIDDVGMEGKVFEMNDGTNIKERTQYDSDTVPIDSEMDKIMAGFNAAIIEGRTPSPSEAIFDGIRFAYKISSRTGAGLNESITDTIARELADEISNAGIAVTAAKQPKKQARKAYIATVQAKKQADELLTGPLQEQFKKLMTLTSPSGTPYSQFKSVLNATTQKAKLEALGNALKNNVADVELGKKSSKGNPLRTSKEERIFVDNFKKYQALMSEVKEESLRKDIYKKDISSKKPNDGQGFVGDLWGKLKGVMSNTVTYEKPKPSTSPIDMPVLKPESPHLLKTPAKAPSAKYNIRGHEVPEEEFDDIARIMYGEISNRPDDRKKLETQVILNVAANRVGKQGFANNDSLPNVFRAPNQFQAYAPDGIDVDGKRVRSQYQKARDGELDEMSQKKYEEIRRMILELANEPDMTNGATFYVHAKDGTIWYGNTLEEAINNATNHEKKKGLKLSFAR
jgi:hypothetical protein